LGDAGCGRAQSGANFRSIASHSSRSQGETTKHPLAGLGNVLRHDYPSVIDERVWEIVTNDLAALKAVAEQILRGLETNGRI